MEICSCRLRLNNEITYVKNFHLRRHMEESDITLLSLTMFSAIHQNKENVIRINIDFTK